MNTKAREEITNMFIKALEEEKIPWRMSWVVRTPENAMTENRYNGLNRMILSYKAFELQYKDSRWCTFKQAEKNGWKIKKGEKGTPIEFYSLWDTKTKKHITTKENAEMIAKVRNNEMTMEEYREQIKPIIRVSYVFNGDQIEGIPEPKIIMDKKSFENKEEVIGIRDSIISEMNVGFKEGGNSSYYSPVDDYISLPHFNNFRTSEEYLQTFLHESSHATGHESRLNRNIKNAFGTENYAIEELRAEIASSFIYQEIGLEANEKLLDNNKAYIQGWISVLKNDKNELMRAIKDADNIANYVVEKYNKSLDKTMEKSKDVVDIHPKQEVNLAIERSR